MAWFDETIPIQKVRGPLALKHFLSIDPSFKSVVVINDVMPLGEGGTQFCDTMYEGMGKMNILVWQRGEESKNILIYARSHTGAY